MMIVCTKDPDIVDWTGNPVSRATAWDALVVLDRTFDQARATTQLRDAISRLRDDEPFCLSAHGNDTELGDEGPDGWGWTAQTIAAILRQDAPRGYEGPVLIRTCAETIASFAPNLAVALEDLNALDGVWIYGYNRPIPITQTYPGPTRLADKVNLQGTLVD